MAEEHDKIVISSDDLAGPDPVPPVAAPPAFSPPPAAPRPPMAGYGAVLGAQPLPPNLPPVSPQPAAGFPGSGASFSLAKLGANALLIGLIGGAIGGFIGTLVAEPIFSRWSHSWSIFNPPSDFELTLFTAVWVMIVGAFIGFGICSLDGFTSSSPQKGFIDGLKGAGAGAAAGLVGGAVAQVLYKALLSDAGGPNDARAYAARIVAWALFGLLLGVGIGLPFGSRKVVNGLIGGTAGGAAGGLAFQLIASSATSDSAVFRVIGMTITGIGIGVAIGLVERVRKDSWLAVTGGPMTGKEIILYKPVTIIGSDYRCDLVLVKDPGVAAQHVSLNRDASGSVSLYAAPGATVFINGAPVQSHRLRPGDQLGVGGSLLIYQQRTAAPNPSYPGSPISY